MVQAPEPLTAAHALGGFDSGVASLDDWLWRRALQNRVSGASRTFVVCDLPAPSPHEGQVVAYYAQAASAVAKAFYVRLGLAPSPLEPMTLMTTVADLNAALG